jgi:WD40 repeat protein
MAVQPDEGRAPDGPPRRYLITAAVPRVHARPDLDRPELADDVRRMEDLFVGLLGYERAAVTGPDPTKEQLLKALRTFAVSEERRPDDYVVLYFAGHGTIAEQSGRHYLLTADSDHDLRGTALRSEDLVGELWDETGIERLLVLLDACHSEEGMDAALRGALTARRFRPVTGKTAGNGLVMISSCRRKQETAPGALSKALDRAVRDRANADRAPEHLDLNNILYALSQDPRLPAWQQPRTSLLDGTAGLPLFLPNPRYVRGARDRRVDEGDELFARLARQRDDRKTEVTSHFDPRARGTDLPAQDVAHFTGRHAALRAINAWLSPERAAERLCVVTGEPGSGKSAVLGLFAILSDRQRRASLPRDGLPADTVPEPGSIDDSVLASHKSTRQIIDRIATAAGVPGAHSVEALIPALQRRERLVVLIDAVDEALDPQGLVEALMLLSDAELGLPLRLLIGARPHIAVRLGPRALRIDLDDESYTDPAAVRAYAHKVLTAPGSTLVRHRQDHLGAIADAVAEAAGRSFLVALITARTLVREDPPNDPYHPGWRAALPKMPGQAMQRDLERLGADRTRARDLLLPVAFAQGVGLPWGAVWPRLATALAGRPYSGEDIAWLLEVAGSYLVEAEEDHGSVYRVYHQALIDYLREGVDARAVQHTITRVLREIPHPYTRRHLARHAAEGAVLDELVQDADFVLGCDPGHLLAALPSLRTHDGIGAGQALRDIEDMLRERGGRGPDPEARARLRLAAVCRRADRLARTCDEGEPLPWRARWAVWDPQEGARSLAAPPACPGVVVPVAHGGARFLGVVEGPTPLRQWDLLKGDLVWTARLPFGLWEETLTALPALGSYAAVLSTDFGDVRSVTKRVLGNAAVPEARLLHLWELRSGRGTPETWRLPAHPVLDPEGEARGLVPAEQVTVVQAAADTPTDSGGRYAALRFRGGQVVVHDLLRGSGLPEPRRQWRQVHPADVALYERLREQSGAVISATLGPALPERGTRMERPRGTQVTLPPVTCCAAPSGAAPGELLLGHADGSVTVYTVGRHGLRRIVTGHEGPVTSVEVIRSHADGPQVVTAARDGSVRLSSLITGEPVRTLLHGSADVNSLAVHWAGSQWLAAVVTADASLHRIDVDSGRPVGRPLRVGTGEGTVLTALDLRRTPSVVVQTPGRGVQAYDLETGERIGGRTVRHEATAVRMVDGTVWVGGSDGVIHCWPTEHAANATRTEAHDDRVLALGAIRGPGGVPAVVSVGQDHMIRCWSADGTPHELWHRTVPHPYPWELPLYGAAATGRTSTGRDLVVTGEYGGRVRVLVLRDGLAVAEQEFTVPEIVTALCTGRVRGRDVVVVGTDTGRISCWDVTAERWYARGPQPDRERWTTALALAPDGSGRLGVGADDGTVREWSLPECRPLGPARTAHTSRVTALSHVPGPDHPLLVSAGDDRRLVRTGPAGTSVLPKPVSALAGADGGVLCGDDTGDVFLLRHTEDGWHTARSLEAVRPVLAVTVVSHGDVNEVVAGGPDGELLIRDGADGTARGRLRSICGSAVGALATEYAPGPVLRTHSARGIVESWDFADPARRWLGVSELDHRRTPGTWEIRLGERRVAVSWSDFTRRLETRTEPWMTRSALLSLSWSLLTRRRPDPRFTALRLEDLDDGGVFQGDVLGSRARNVLAMNDAHGASLLVVGRSLVRVYAVDPGDLGRAEQLTIHPVPFGVHHATVLPGRRAYAVAGEQAGELAVFGLDADEPQLIDIPSAVTDLAAGPDGMLVVATRNGLVVLD